MQIQVNRVLYTLFRSDVEWLDNNKAATYHEIDREVELRGADGQLLFISWCSQPSQYCIGFRECSFFKSTDNIVTRDMSQNEIWKDLIGETVVLNFLDTNHQVLSIGCAKGNVYCYTSDGEWQADVVRVSKIKPHLP